MKTLKVIDDEENGVFKSDDESSYGGIDMLQRYMFAHLFPDGYCPWVFRELVFDLAEAHGWGVEVRVVKATR